MFVYVWLLKIVSQGFCLTPVNASIRKVLKLTIDVDLDRRLQRLFDGLVFSFADELRTEITAAESDSNLVPAGTGPVRFLKRTCFAWKLYETICKYM